MIMKSRLLFWTATTAIILGGFYLLNPGKWRQFSRDNSSEPEWKLLRSDEGGFSVLMPGSPTPGTKTWGVPGGLQIKAKTYTLEGDPGFFAYSFDQPAGFEEIADEVMLNDMRDGILSEARGRLIEERHVSLNGYPGREVAIEYPDPQYHSVQVGRFYLAKRRVYLVVAAMSKSGARDESVRRFLDSLKLEER